MNAVGIDVSKGKSTVTIRRPGNVVVLPPCDISHIRSGIDSLIEQIKALDGETKTCMDHTAGITSLWLYGCHLPAYLSAQSTLCLFTNSNSFPQPYYLTEKAET